MTLKLCPLQTKRKLQHLQLQSGMTHSFGLIVKQSTLMRDNLPLRALLRASSIGIIPGCGGSDNIFKIT